MHGDEVAVETILRTVQGGETIHYLKLSEGGFCPMCLPMDDVDYFQRIGPLPEPAAKRTEVLQKNVVLVVRNLIREEPRWAEIFIEAMVSAVAATPAAKDPSDISNVDVKVWPHVLVLGGLQHVVGMGPPPAARVAAAMPDLVSRVLSHPMRQDGLSPTFRILRARLLKAVWESSTDG